MRSNEKVKLIGNLAWKSILKQKPRLIFGIIGILLSCFLTTSVGILNDSLSYSAVETVATVLGEGDVWITKKNLLDPQSQIYFDKNEIFGYMNDIPEIDRFYPRIVELTKIYSNNSVSSNFYSIFATETAKEARDKFDFWLVNSTNETYASNIPFGKCLVTSTLALEYNLSIGETLQIYWRDTRIISIQVHEIVTRQGVLGRFLPSVIVLDLEYAQSLFAIKDYINLAIFTFKNSEQYYTSRNIPASLIAIRDIGVKIGRGLPEDYDYYLPKYVILKNAEPIFIPFSVLYWFIMIITLIIAGILIYGILLTSSEELIYEFGVMRTLGAKKYHIYTIIGIIGVIMSIIGSGLGILISIALSPYYIPFFSNLLDLANLNIKMVLIPQNILQSAYILAGLSIIISLLPAKRVSNVAITDALSPFRASNTFELVKIESNPNKNLLFLGLFVSVLGVIFFVLFPTLLAYLNFFFLSMIFVILLILMLVGFCLIVVNLIPYMEMLLNWLIQFLGRGLRKTTAITYSKLKKQKDKELTTKISITISFIFIFFITNMTQLLPTLTKETLGFQYGSDLVVFDNSDAQNPQVLDSSFLDNLRAVPGVRQVAPILYTGLDLMKLYSGGQFAFDNAKYNVSLTLSDLINYDSAEVALVGVDESFLDTVEPADFKMQNVKESFDRMIYENNSIIISSSLADHLNVKIDDFVRFKVRKSTANESQIYLLKIVGITGRVPGFWNFREAFYSVYLQPAVMVSINLFQSLFGIDVNMVGFDKFFVDCFNKDQIELVQSRITEQFGSDYAIIVDNANSKLDLFYSLFDTFEVIFTIILYFAIIISIFTYFAGVLRTVIEKKREFGLLHVLGLSRFDARVMYFKDLMMTFITSSIMGTFFGLFLSNFIKFELTYILEIPFISSLPWNSIYSILGYNSLIAAVGTWLLVYFYTREPVLNMIGRFG